MISLCKHIHFETIDSTNTWAKQNWDKWNLEGVTLITASQQTHGRGRFKRKWESPAHLNIYATFCFWLDLNRLDIGYIPQLLALAAAKILDDQALNAKIKWPNDVLVNHKKIAGILCETITENSKRGIVCGIGLNVNMPLDYLIQIDQPATSLLVEKEASFDIQTILFHLQNVFIDFLNQFLDKGFSYFYLLLQQKSAYQKNQKIKFYTHQTVLNAYFESLNLDGSVTLRLYNGETHNYHSGEFLF